ncbi:MAG: ABC transporter permease [Bacteroidales bacterium]|nr:ABC transporter permease [Clostridium sp.]MCM1204285.1 ABC transporter permease [Bacteroidales bacterium]
MKLKMIYKYAADRTVRRLIRYVMTIALSMVMFLLLLVSLFAWKYIRRERTACNHCLNGGIKQAGMLFFEEYTEEFLEDVLNLDEVTGVTSGDVYQPTVDMIEELGRQQEKSDPEYVKRQNGVPWFYMSSTGVDVCHLNLSDGKPPEEWNLAKDESLIYLGANFKNIPVGTRYDCEFEETTYVVGGILEKETCWIRDDVYIFESITDTRYVENLDNMVVYICPSLISLRCTYTVKDGYSLEEAEQKILQLAKKHRAKIKTARLEDVIDENEYQYSHLLKAIRTMTWIIMITALVILERVQFSEMISDTEYFGIFYANGASTRDLAFILVGENLLKVAVSYLLAGVTGYFVLLSTWKIFQPGIDNWRNVKSIYFEQAMLPAFLIGLLIVGLATLKPILWIRKKSPVELIQEYRV